MGKKKIDECDCKKILQLKQYGHTNAEIASMFDVTPSRIGQILRKNGIISINKHSIRLSEYDCQNIVDLYQQGVSSVKLGEMFNCTRAQIARVLHENGIELDTVLRKISSDEYENIIDLYNGGKTQKEISEIYGCSANVICKIMKKNGVKTRPNGFTAEDAKNMYEMYKQGDTMDKIADAYETDRHTVGRVFKRNNLIVDKKTYHCNEHYFDVIDDSNKAYILGLLWSDGHNNEKIGKITLQLQERDKKVLEDISEVLQSNMPLWFLNLHDKNPNWSNTYTLSLRSKHMSEVLASYGMVQNKSLVLEFPEWIDESLYSHFIRGMIDGDGSICYQIDRNSIRVDIIGTKMVLSAIQNIYNEIGVKSTMYHNNKMNDVICRLYTTSNGDTLRLLKWLYDNADIKMQRKYEKYQQFLQNNNINNSLAS